MQRDSVIKKLDSDFIDTLCTWDGLEPLTDENRERVKKNLAPFFAGQQAETPSSVQCQNLYGIGGAFTFQETKALLDTLLQEPKDEKANPLLKNKLELILIYSCNSSAKQYPQRVTALIKKEDQVTMIVYDGRVYEHFDIHQTELLCKHLFGINRFLVPEHYYPLAFRVIGVVPGDIYPMESPLRFPRANEILANLKVVKDKNVNAIYVGTASASPLERAFMSGNPDAVTFFLQHDADPYSCGGRSLEVFATTDELKKLLFTALLMFAAQKGFAEDVTHFLSLGFDVNTVDLAVKATPLHYAAYGGKKAVMELLIKRGANIEATTKYGGTPLHYAAACNLEAVKLLVEHRANVNAMADKRMTPLHNAASYGQADIVKYLVSSGADLFAVTTEGKMPYELTKNPVIKQYLLERMLVFWIKNNDSPSAKYFIKQSDGLLYPLLKKIKSAGKRVISGMVISDEMFATLAQEECKFSLKNYVSVKKSELKESEDDCLWDLFHPYTARKITAAEDMLSSLEEGKPLQTDPILLEKSDRLRAFNEEIKSMPGYKR